VKEKERMREDLRRLDELARSSALDPAARARLAEIARDIEALLDEREAAETRESLVDRLRSAAEHFEESHPSLTAAVGRIADALAALGI
jgi:hypothetical protein